MSRNVEEAKKEEDLEDPRGAKDVKDHDKEEEGSDEEDADETSDKPPTSMRRMAKQPTKPRVSRSKSDVEDSSIVIGRERVRVKLEDFAEPDHDIAEQVYAFRHPMFRGRNGEIKPLSLALKPKKIMQRFGSGIYLYFRVLRLLTYLLLSMTIVAIPWVVVINLGTPIDEFGTEIEFSRPKGVLGIDRLILRTTFGWLWQDWSRTPRQNWDGMRVRIPFSDHIIRRDTLQYVIAGLDLVGILWLLAAVRALYKWASEKAAEQEDRDTVTITDYAVLVRGLPKDASAEEVHKFFDKRYGGPVAEVQLIANDMKIIKYYQTFSKLVLKLGVAVGVHIWRKDNATQVDKVAAKAGKISEKIAQMRQRQDWKVLCAYVTFKHARTRDVCIATTQRTGFWGWIGSRFCTAKKNRFRGKHTLRISEAPSPADIIYENLRYSRVETFLRRFIVLVIVIALLIGNVLFVSFLRDAAGSLAAEASSKEEMYQEIGLDPEGSSAAEKEAAVATVCQERIDACAVPLAPASPLLYGVFVSDQDVPGYSADSVVDTLQACYKNDSCTATEQSCYPCYCNGLLASLDIKNVSLQTLVTLKAHCSPFIRDLTAQIIVQVSLSVLVVLMNIVLKVIMTVLVGFEKYSSTSEHEAAVCVKVALVQFINVATTELLASGRVDSVADMLKDTPFEGFFLSGSYRDLGREWYADVGMSLHVTLALVIVKILVVKNLPFLIRRIKVNKASQNAVIQQQLDDAYTGPKFKLASYIAEVLVLIMVAIVYGAAMPLLYFIAALGCWITIRLDKRLLLRICTTPTRYGPHLAEVMLKLTLLAGVIHLPVAAWMHSHFFGRPLADAAGSEAAGSTANDAASAGPFQIDQDVVYSEKEWSQKVERITQTQAFPFVLLLVLIILFFYVVKPVVKLAFTAADGVLGELLGLKKCLGCCCRRNRKVAPNRAVKDIATAIQLTSGEDGALEGPASFAITEQQRYGEAFRTTGKLASKVGLGHMTAAQDFRGLSVMSQAVVAKDLFNAQSANSLKQKSFRRRTGRSGVSSTGLNPKSRKNTRMASRFSMGVADIPKAQEAHVRDE